MRYKGGKRESMTPLEVEFARIYDRLRKRAQREFDTPMNFLEQAVFGVNRPKVHAQGYFAGVTDALDAVAEVLDRGVGE